MELHLVVKLCYIVSGFFYSAAPEWGIHTNATGTKMKLHEFKHPFFLACLRYLAQLFCFALYLIAFGRRTDVRPLPQAAPAAPRRPQPRPGRQYNQNFPPEQRDTTKYNKLIFLPCTLCDMGRTGLLYVGMRLTYPSSFIMLNGIVTFFTALLSVAFLATPLQNRMWFGVCINVCGLVLIGLRDYIHNEQFTSYDPYGIAAGDLLIVMAMIMTAIQVILEEKFVKKHNISPLLVIGIEGLFGFFLSFILVIIFYFIHVGAFSYLPEHRLEDSIDAFLQLKNSWQVALSLIGSIVSVCLYFYFGITIAKKHDHGAVSRMVLDNIASLLFFGLYLSVRWQKADILMVPGYILVILGLMIYYDFVFYTIYRYIRAKLGYREPLIPAPRDETEPLLPVAGQDNYHSVQEAANMNGRNGMCQDVRQRPKPI